MAVKQIKTFDEFKNIINKGVTFVDFFTTWCGPCKMLSPIVDEVSEEVTNMKFIKVDIDQMHDAAEVYGVQSIPTIIIFKDGKPINSFLGYRPKSEVLKFINEKK
ncbi:MAG: thioredoxin [Mycoplasmataceae bacterium]|jgi:thioredoxin 1|nr:thioredoxin [Mycoplasmataceae bacterium]